MMPVTFKKKIKIFLQPKPCILSFLKDLKYKNYHPLILYDASHQEVLLCVHTSIRCPSSMSIEHVFRNGTRFKVYILKRFKI